GLDGRQRGVARRVAKLQALQRLLHGSRDHQVAMRLRFGRDDRPRRPRRSGRRDRLGVRLLVCVPAGALLEVADRELPVLGRIVESVMEALTLLVLRDVEEYLDDELAVLGKQLPE